MVLKRPHSSVSNKVLPWSVDTSNIINSIYYLFEGWGQLIINDVSLMINVFWIIAYVSIASIYSIHLQPSLGQYWASRKATSVFIQSRVSFLNNKIFDWNLCMVCSHVRKREIFLSEPLSYFFIADFTEPINKKYNKSSNNWRFLQFSTIFWGIKCLISNYISLYSYHKGSNLSKRESKIPVLTKNSNKLTV